MLRKIAAISLVVPEEGLLPLATSAPKFVKVPLAALVVDETYQRGLSERSLKLIRRLVTEWDWRSFAPPVVVAVGDWYHVIDGQHTAIAAATRGDFKELPVQLVESSPPKERAQVFLHRNLNRLIVTPTQLYYAALAAQDEDALTIDSICRRAGVRVLKNPLPVCKPGDTIAISTIRKLVNRRLVGQVRQVLEIAAKAKLAPISRDVMLALDSVLFGVHKLVRQPNDEDLVTKLRSFGPELGAASKSVAAKRNVTQWEAVVHLLGGSVPVRASPNKPTSGSR